MIHLTPHRDALLRDVIAAGDEGLPFRTIRKATRYGMGDALALMLDGLVDGDERTERLTVTSKGRTFAARTAA